MSTSSSPNRPDAIDLSLPSVRQFQRYVKEKQTLELKLMTGETLSGPLNWLDAAGLSIQVNNRPLFVWYHAIAYLQPVG